MRHLSQMALAALRGVAPEVCAAMPSDILACSGKSWLPIKHRKGLRVTAFHMIQHNGVEADSVPDCPRCAVLWDAALGGTPPAPITPHGPESSE